MIPMVLQALASKLAAEGLGLIGNAVLAKGKDVVEKKLGVDLERSLGTEEGRIRLMQLQAENERDLHAFVLAQREQDLSALKANLADVANSRESNARIQESAHASWLAKNAGYILDFVIVGASLLLVSLLMFQAVPPENKEIAFALLGSLVTLCSTVVQWHRGSSSGSQRKTDELAALAGKMGKP